MATKDEALDQILAIARSHDLTVDDVSNVMANAAKDVDQTKTGTMSRILGLLGGTFLFAGISVFIGLNWDVMNAAARIIVTFGSGLAAFVLALIAASQKDYVQARSPLYAIAAILQPTGMLVAINEFSSGGDWRYAVLVTAGVMALQQGSVFWQKRDTTLLFTTIAFSYWVLGIGLDLLEMELDLIALVIGASMIALCVGLERTPHRSLTSTWFLFGSCAFYGGMFSLIEDSPIEILFLAFASSGVFLSTYVRSRMLLSVSTGAILLYVSYFTQEHFLDSVGWPFLLMFLGLLMIALGSLAVRINRRYISGE